MLILGLLLISIKSEQTEGAAGDETTGEDNDVDTTDDKALFNAKNDNKNECLKVELSSDDKKCCFYDVTPPEGEKFTSCVPKLTEAEKKENEDEGYKLKEHCNGKFITTSILVLLALLFL